MPNTAIHKTIALFIILSLLSSLSRAEDNAVSFITARLVRCSQDKAGNTWDDIVVSNTHHSRMIKLAVTWIGSVREREKDLVLKPGEEKTIARDQSNARDLHIGWAQFK